MRILFVAMSNSIHTARWISQAADQGWDLHLFPSYDNGISHPKLQNITVHHSFYPRQKDLDRSVSSKGVPVLYIKLANIARYILGRKSPNYRLHQLNRVIRRIKPDIIHSLEIQGAGYLTLDAKKNHTGNFPPWIVTNWGSDIYLYGRLREHRDRIRSVLSFCDYYSCECQRDVQLARDLGFEGEVLPVFPNTGGFDLTQVSRLRTEGQTSERRLILVKGYQSWAGRALVGLRAISLCADQLKGYRVAVYLANPDVVIAAELVSQSTGIPIDIINYRSHEDMLKLFGKARIYLGLSISDAISTSLLEAMTMGAFPIQSCTSCANEWVEDGKTAFIVPPEDPTEIASAITRAVDDDALVDTAAVLNTLTIANRLDKNDIQPQVIELYIQISQK